MKLLVSKGADVNYCTLDYSGDADENYPDVTYDENDNDNGVNNYTSDSSPLHLAVTKLHLEVVKVIKI